MEKRLMLLMFLVLNNWPPSYCTPIANIHVNVNVDVNVNVAKENGADFSGPHGGYASTTVITTEAPQTESPASTTVIPTEAPQTETPVPLSPTVVQAPSTTTKKTFVTTPKSIAVDCPDSEGYYQAPSSQQCFRYYEKYITWQQAKDKCASEGMVMAKPEERSAEELRQYLVDTYGYVDGWLGARGSGQAIVWEGTNTVVSTSWWWPGHPGWRLGNDRCLLMYLGSTRPYYRSWPCSETAGTLCEVTNE